MKEISMMLEHSVLAQQGGRYTRSPAHLTSPSEAAVLSAR